MRNNENTKRLYVKISLFRTSNEVSDNLIKTNKKNIPNINMIETNDSFTLLLSMIKVLNGESGLVDTIDKMNRDLGSYQKTFNDKFIMEYVAEMGGNDSLPLYNDYVENGYNINITTLDKDREYFKDNIEYKKNTLDHFLYSLIRNPNKDVQYVDNMVFKYNNTTGDINIKFINPNVKMVDVISSVLNKGKRYTSQDMMFDILDNMFNLRNKSEQQLKDNLEVELTLTNDIVATIDDSYYTFTREDIEYVENKIILKGEFYYGDPEFDGKFTMEDYNKVKTSKNLFNVSFLTLVLEILLGSVGAKYKEIARKNFFEKFLTSYKNVLLTKIILSTEMLLLYNLCFRRDNLDRMGVLKMNRDFIKCTSNKYINAILNTLYKIVKREILKLVGTATLIQTKESLTKYRKILTSLKLF